MAKYDAYGTNLYRGTSGGGTIIAQVQSIGGPGLSADTVDVTSHDSTGAWEEVVVSILRSGEITLDIVYDPANATARKELGYEKDSKGVWMSKPSTVRPVSNRRSDQSA